MLLFSFNFALHQGRLVPEKTREKESKRKIEFKACVGLFGWVEIFICWDAKYDNPKIQHFTLFSFIFLEFHESQTEG